MPKRFVLVSGDRGAAKAHIPVANELLRCGHDVMVYADSKGLAAQDIAASGLKHVITGIDCDHVANLAYGDLALVGTSASATELELAFVRSSRIPVVLASDGLFNHALPMWRDVRPRHWLALDESHAAAIRALRPEMAPAQVVVTGQPAFDDAIEIMANKNLVRTRVRKALGVADSTPMVVWWSTGMASVAHEDLEMVYGALHYGARPLAMAFRMHPKLDTTVGAGYIQRTLAGLWSATGTAAIDRVAADAVPGIELCLAADAILSITCTEDIKSTLIGGPPVVHLIGPKVREWFEGDLGLQAPHYLPDVAAGLSLAAYDPQDVALCLSRALHTTVRQMLRTVWQPPQGPATQRTVNFLERLA